MSRSNLIQRAFIQPLLVLVLSAALYCWIISGGALTWMRQAALIAGMITYSALAAVLAAGRTSDLRDEITLQAVPDAVPKNPQSAH
jgi:hypothetical protein